MNENCKYCKTAKTCLENADYNSIYCQIHKRIPKVIDKTYDELLKENKQLKEKLERVEKANKEAIEYIKSDDSYVYEHDDIPYYLYDTCAGDDLLEILDTDKGE